MFNMSSLKLSITACSRGCWIRLGSKRSLLTLFEMCILRLEKWLGRGVRDLCLEISYYIMYFSAILDKYATANAYLAGVCGYWLSVAVERKKKHRQNAEFLDVWAMLVLETNFWSPFPLRKYHLISVEYHSWDLCHKHMHFYPHGKNELQGTETRKRVMVSQKCAWGIPPLIRGRT